MMKLAAVLLFSLLAKPATSQMYGYGFGKATWRTSDAGATYNWLQSHLPVVEDHPNGAVACGNVGRTRIQQYAGQEGFSQGFGLHSVHVNKSSVRYHPTHCATAVQVERELTARFASHPNSYDPFYDFSNGHWVSNLDPYVAGFRKANQPVVVLSWSDPANGNKNYFSVLARADTSMMFVELMSGKCTLCTNAIASSPRYFFNAGDSPAELFGPLNDTEAAKPLLHPAKVTWPSSNVTRERKLLQAGLGAKYTSHNTQDALTDVYDFRPLMTGATLQFHVTQRAQNKTDGNVTATWATFEDALNKCHRATIVDDLCGENPWMDNHMGFALHGEAGPVKTDAATLKALATKLNLPFHVTTVGGPPNMPHRSGYAVYVIAANGLSMAFQVEAGTYKPPRTPKDGMLDLCDQGTCANASTFFN